MKIFFTLFMPLLMVISFLLSSHFFAQADYLVSAVFTLASYSATSLWIAVISTKKLALH